MISFHSHNDWLIVLLIMTSVGSGSVIWRQTMMPSLVRVVTSLQRRHNERDVVSNHQPHDCLLNCLFRRTSKKTSKLRVTGLCVGNSPGTGEFPAQMASYAEKISILWRHHAMWNIVFHTPIILLRLKWDGANPKMAPSTRLCFTVLCQQYR